MAEPPELVQRTRVAASAYDEHRFCGARVFAELAGHSTLTSLCALGITGRRLRPEQLGVLDDLAACWTIADPRIWPLKVARIAASHGGVLQGVAAGLLSMDCRYVGVYQTAPAAAALLSAVAAEGGHSEDQRGLDQLLERRFAQRRYIPGFGVAFREIDERLVPFEDCLGARGDRQALPFYRLFRRVGCWAVSSRKMPPNIAGAAAAALLDLGFALDEIGALTTSLSLHMFWANAFEGAQERSPWLRCLPPESIRYEGPAPRLSPRAAVVGAQDSRSSRK